MPKTKRNNHVRPAEGEPDIECSCFYDTDRSRMEFEENFKVLQHSGYRTSSVLYYIASGNIPDDSEIKFTVKGSRERREEYLLETGYHEAEDVKTWDDDTLNTEILGNEEDVNLINYALDKLPSIPGIDFTPTKNLIAISTSGYSQGDYSTVLYCPEDLEKAWGNYPKQEDIQKMVNHYCWDSPIYCQFEIDGKEYNYWDMPDYDDYKWDRDAFLDYVSKESGIDKEKLESFVPENPEYN